MTQKSKRLFASALLAMLMAFSLVGGSLAIPAPAQGADDLSWSNQGVKIDGFPFYLVIDITSPADGARFTACNNFTVEARIKNKTVTLESKGGQVEGSTPGNAYCVQAHIDWVGPASTEEPVTKDLTEDCEYMEPGDTATVKWKLHCDGPGEVVIYVQARGFLNCYECGDRICEEVLYSEVDVITVRQFAAAAPQPRASACSATTPGSVCCSPKTLTISPEVASAGQAVTIAASIGNDGDADTAYSAVLAINGQVVETRTVNISPHGACPVSFTVYKDRPGTYTVDIGGRQASFTVVGDAAGSPAGNSGGLIAVLVLAMLVVATAVVLVMAFRKRPA